jgi:hypothetical protein
MAMMPYLLTPKQKKCARKILIIATKKKPSKDVTPSVAANLGSGSKIFW